MTIFALNHGFVFLANQKAASTTVHHLLFSKADAMFYRPRRGKHLPLSRAAEFTARCSSKKFGKLFSFGIIRRPEDWVYSWYRFRLRSGIKDPTHPSHRMSVSADCSFNDFVEEVVADRPQQYARLRDQHRYLWSEADQAGVTFIARFENLAEDLGILSRYEPLRALRGAADTVINASQAASQRAELSDSLRSKLLTKFEQDVELYDRVVAGEHRHLPERLAPSRFTMNLTDEESAENAISRALISGKLGNFADASSWLRGQDSELLQAPETRALMKSLSRRGYGTVSDA